MYKFEDGDFHCPLVEVGWFILDDFDGDDFHRFHILAFHHLSKRTLSQNIQNQVPVVNSLPSAVLLVSLISAEDVVDVEDVITVIVIETIVLGSLSRFRQTPPRIPRRFIRKLIVTKPISRW